MPPLPHTFHDVNKIMDKRKWRSILLVTNSLHGQWKIVIGSSLSHGKHRSVYVYICAVAGKDTKTNIYSTPEIAKFKGFTVAKKQQRQLTGLVKQNDKKELEVKRWQQRPLPNVPWHTFNTNLINFCTNWCPVCVSQFHGCPVSTHNLR